MNDIVRMTSSRLRGALADAASAEPVAPAYFAPARRGRGADQWARYKLNIQRGCSHRCLYCYAAANAIRFKLSTRAEWGTETLTARAEMTSYPSRGELVMFPTAHDVTADNIEAFARVAKLVLARGNPVLIVTKPHLACIEYLTQKLAEYRDYVLFRFSITTMDEQLAAFWEPGAPAPSERIKALATAFGAGFATSISAEPLLGGLEAAEAILEAATPYVTESIWIGKMNQGRRRMDLTVPANVAALECLEAQQADHEIRRMVAALDGRPLLEWKDSISEVMAREPTA